MNVVSLTQTSIVVNFTEINKLQFQHKFHLDGSPQRIPLAPNSTKSSPNFLFLVHSTHTRPTQIPTAFAEFA
jgi:hypothetical protein